MPCTTHPPAAPPAPSACAAATRERRWQYHVAASCTNALQPYVWSACSDCQWCWQVTTTERAACSSCVQFFCLLVTSIAFTFCWWPWQLDIIMGSSARWQQPSGEQHANVQLQVHNTLTNSKVPLVGSGNDPKSLTWYTCGPTVYDSAHLGHAKNYVSCDIVRRVLEDYFGYNILMVMNVTDVEDKIVYRARRNFLLDGYRCQHGGNAAKVCLPYCCFFYVIQLICCRFGKMSLLRLTIAKPSKRPRLLRWRSAWPLAWQQTSRYV